MIEPERLQDLRRQLALEVLAGKSNIVSAMFIGDGTRYGELLNVSGQCDVLIAEVAGPSRTPGSGEQFGVSVPRTEADELCRDLMAVGFRVMSQDAKMLPVGVELIEFQ